MCPRCQSPEVGRSHRRRLGDLFMRLWGMKPYRCRQCRSRFYLPSRFESKLKAQGSWLRSIHAEPTPPQSSSSHRSR